MRGHRKIAVYGICRRDESDVMLVREPGNPSRWVLPGGVVAHGEHPTDALVRTIGEQIGADVVAQQVLRVVVDMDVPPNVAIASHRDCLIFEVRLGDGPLLTSARRLGDLSRTDVSRIAWADPDSLVSTDVAPWVPRALSLSGSDDDFTLVPGWPTSQLPSTATAGLGSVQPGTSRQRFAAYGLVTDPADRVLLTMIADGYPGAGSWHLPGGGTDFAEAADRGLLRELVEETDQHGRIIDLLAVSHRRSQALGPEGVPLDWHSVRVVFRVVVDEPTAARVTEARGGSTADAAWFSPHNVLDLELTDIARATIEAHLCVG